ncbi:TPA: hypothetical protein J1257_004981, partial [Escherichia coli]|nr:hypothetical protein [Escherichia coli]
KKIKPDIKTTIREVDPLAADPATERSERVVEEAEERRKLHFLLTHKANIFTSHKA